MHFTLTINCTGAAFAATHDEAEPEHHEHARDIELARILYDITCSLQRGEISTGILRDTNGNQCGSYAFHEAETLDEMLARHQRELVEQFPNQLAAVTAAYQLIEPLLHIQSTTD